MQKKFILTAAYKIEQHNVILIMNSEQEYKGTSKLNILKFTSCYPWAELALKFWEGVLL